MVFQLEEGETLTEPVPSREARRAILAVEASEGGAGALGRLVTEPQHVSRVAKATLGLMHYNDLDAAIAAADPKLLADDPSASCVKGCYRCLLSYYNQPDHELIDRTDPEVLRVLLRLARSEVSPVEHSEPDSTCSEWIAAFGRWGLPKPYGAPLSANGELLPLVWPEHRVAAAIGTLAEETRKAVDDLAYSAVVLPERPGDAAPAKLTELLEDGS